MKRFYIKLDSANNHIEEVEETRSQYLAKLSKMNKKQRRFFTSAYQTRIETPEGKTSRQEALDRVAKLNKANK